MFPQLDHQKRIIAKSIRKKKHGNGRESPSPEVSLARKRLEEKVPKAYRLNKQSESSEDSSSLVVSDEEVRSISDLSVEDDSGLESATSVPQEKLENVQVSSLLSDMQKLKEDLIRRNEYEKLKEKFKQSDSDDE